MAELSVNKNVYTVFGIACLNYKLKDSLRITRVHDDSFGIFYIIVKFLSDIVLLDLTTQIDIIIKKICLNFFCQVLLNKFKYKLKLITQFLNNINELKCLNVKPIF